MIKFFEFDAINVATKNVRIVGRYQEFGSPGSHVNLFYMRKRLS